MFPVRMNLIEIGICQLHRGATTPLDPDFLEAESYRNYDDEVRIPGQVISTRQWNKMDRSKTGDKEPSTGGILFRPCDLEKTNLSLQKGDRVVAMYTCGRRMDVDFNIIHVAPYAPLRGNIILILAEYEEQKKRLASE